MKSWKTTLLSLPLLTTVLALSGCRALDRTFFKPTAWQTNAVPEQVVQVKTNQLVIVAQTNAAGQVTGYATNREPLVLNVTVPAHSEATPIAWAPNDQTTGAIGFLSQFGGPYGGLAGTAVTGILGVIAALRGRKYRDAAVSLAQGIQHAAEAMPDTAPKLVAIQKAVQNEAGTRSTVADLISKFVESRPSL